jgi:hypothetical protein
MFMCRFEPSQRLFEIYAASLIEEVIDVQKEDRLVALSGLVCELDASGVSLILEHEMDPADKRSMLGREVGTDVRKEVEVIGQLDYVPGHAQAIDVPQPNALDPGGLGDFAVGGEPLIDQREVFLPRLIGRQPRDREEMRTDLQSAA